MRDRRTNDSARRGGGARLAPMLNSDDSSRLANWRLCNQKIISAPSVLKERPETYSWSGQAKIPQIKNTPRLAKRCSFRSPRRTRRSKWACTMLCAYACCIGVRTTTSVTRRQAKSHARNKMRDCSSSKSLRAAICIDSTPIVLGAARQAIIAAYCPSVVPKQGQQNNDRQRHANQPQQSASSKAHSSLHFLTRI